MIFFQLLRFAIKQNDRIERIQEYLKNILRIRKFFIDTFGIDPPIINGDQVSFDLSNVFNFFRAVYYIYDIFKSPKSFGEF